MAPNHNTYELTYVVNAVISDTQVQDLIKRVSTYVTENGGEVIEVDQWGSRRLAYPIMKKRNGFYVNMYFTAPGSIILRLERALQIDDNVLRYLTMKMDAKMLRHYAYQKTVRTTHAPIEDKPKSDSRPGKPARSDNKPESKSEGKSDGTEVASKGAATEAAATEAAAAPADVTADTDTPAVEKAAPEEVVAEEVTSEAKTADPPEESVPETETTADTDADTESEAATEESETKNPKAEGAEA